MSDDDDRTPISLFEIIIGAVRRGLLLTLVDAVAQSRKTGAYEHITVETVFTDSENPLRLISPRGVEYRADDFGNATVLTVNDGESEWFLASWPTGLEGVYHVVTTLHPTSKEWGRADRWLRKTRGVIRPFLNHRDFEQIGTALSEFGDVAVGRVASRSAYDGSSDTRGYPASEYDVRPNHAEVVGAMEAAGYSVRTLTLHVDRTLSLHLRRRAGATYYSGRFDVFAGVVLGALARAAAERRTLVGGRQRIPGERVRPVSIALPLVQLEGAESTGKVIREVAGLTKMTLAILHRNPYLHFAVSDEVDGSNFDIVVAEAESIDVYPGYRATPGALSRLIDHLSDRFGGSQVAERAAHDFSLADLGLE